MNHKFIFLSLILGCTIVERSFAQDDYSELQQDISNWKWEKYDESFFSDRLVCGQSAVDYVMQVDNWLYNRYNSVDKMQIPELLLSKDPILVAMGNENLRKRCDNILSDLDGWRSWFYNNGMPPERRDISMIITYTLRYAQLIENETVEKVGELLEKIDIPSKEASIFRWLYKDVDSPEKGMADPGGNCSNGHGCLTILTMAPAIIDNEIVEKAGFDGLRNELNHLNETGDISEYNCLESHWANISSWTLMRRFIPNPYYRRIANLITERSWINKFLTWSSAVERITGPGSRMAPTEWLGTDNERVYFSMGLDRPIWNNYYFQWDSWDARSSKGIWEPTRAEAIPIQLPEYLTEIAWDKKYPNVLKTRVNLNHWDRIHPYLEGAPLVNAKRPMQYVNYQTSNYTLGSSTSKWYVKACIVAASAWWNDSKSNEPIGSPKKFSVLFPHYVFNGMSLFDKGDIYYEGANDSVVDVASGNVKYLRHNLIRDEKGGLGGTWLREFIEYGRPATLQDRNTMILLYSPFPGTHADGQTLVKGKINRASGAMFFYRWRDGYDGMYINKEPILTLPQKFSLSDWWFIKDGDVYIAVRALKHTNLRGESTIRLEKRNHAIVLYADNMNGDNIYGITDEQWVKAQSGFIVEMGNKDEFQSFEKFQEDILKGKVIEDSSDGFVRKVHYVRGEKDLKLEWNCYSEEYITREIASHQDPWVEYLNSPNFVVSKKAAVTPDAKVFTKDSSSCLWLLSAPKTSNWVVYQPNFGKEIPINLDCPIGEVSTMNLPLGKLVMKKLSHDTLKLSIDASYSLNSRNLKKSELIIKTKLPYVKVEINGCEYAAHKSKHDGVWIVDPYSNLDYIRKSEENLYILSR